MEKQKIFSIILPTFNSGEKVEITLKSILLNDPELFELIIIDANSTDFTVSHIKKYLDHLTLISEADDGVYDAFNKGIQQSSGRYLYFIGAGDTLRPGILRHLSTKLPNTPANLIYGNCYFVKQKFVNGKLFTPISFIRDNLCQQGIFYERNIFDIVGNFDLKYKLFADWFFNLKCFLDKNITTTYLNIVVADYEEGGLSSDIGRDPVFKKDFPKYVKTQFGWGSYIVCKVFLIEPMVFNCIHELKFPFLAQYLISTYKFPAFVYKLVKPIARSYLNLT